MYTMVHCDREIAVMGGLTNVANWMSDLALGWETEPKDSNRAKLADDSPASGSMVCAGNNRAIDATKRIVPLNVTIRESSLVSRYDRPNDHRSISLYVGKYGIGGRDEGHLFRQKDNFDSKLALVATISSEGNQHNGPRLERKKPGVVVKEAVFSELRRVFSGPGRRRCFR